MRNHAKSCEIGEVFVSITWRGKYARLVDFIGFKQFSSYNLCRVRLMYQNIPEWDDPFYFLFANNSFVAQPDHTLPVSSSPAKLVVPHLQLVPARVSMRSPAPAMGWESERSWENGGLHDFVHQGPKWNAKVATCSWIFPVLCAIVVF